MKFDLGLWANSGDQIQNRTLHRTKRETTYIFNFYFTIIVLVAEEAV